MEDRAKVVIAIVWEAAHVFSASSSRDVLFQMFAANDDFEEKVDINDATRLWIIPGE